MAPLAGQPRRVLVTGAASGIGKATALLLRERGVAVVATDRSPDGLAELARAGAETVVADVTVANDRAALLTAAGDADGLVNAAGIMRVIPAALLTAAGDADGLVNAAGIMRVIPLAAVSDADWDAILAVNLKAAFYLARDLGARMRGGGAIVNLSSVAARRGDNAEVLCYAASKAAVLAVTRSLAHAYGPRGVRVNAVLPGLIDTPMQDGVLDRVSAIRGVPRDELEAGRLRPVVLEHRSGTPRECADAIAYLLSDASSYITGQALSVDGGIVMP